MEGSDGVHLSGEDEEWKKEREWATASVRGEREGKKGRKRKYGVQGWPTENTEDDREWDGQEET